MEIYICSAVLHLFLLQTQTPPLQKRGGVTFECNQFKDICAVMPTMAMAIGHCSVPLYKWEPEGPYNTRDCFATV